MEPSSSTSSSPPTPTPHRNIAIKISFHAFHVSKALSQANTELSNFKPQAALKIYTDVLNRLSIGHPVAFLNRSLCYLVLGYHNLAALDAYRGIVAAQLAKGANNVTNPRARQLYVAVQYFQQATEEKDPWIAAPACYTGKGTFPWLSRDLSSLPITAHERSRDTKQARSGTEQRWLVRHAANDAILNGYFRLALALWKCGGGALKSALDVLGDAQSLPFVWRNDLVQFKDLENRILHDIEKLMNEERENRQLLSKAINREMKDYYDDQGIRGLLRTRFTKIRRELYPWDTFSLTSENLDQALPSFTQDVLQHVRGCGLEIHTAPGRAPRPYLYCEEHILGATTLFTETSSFYVTTSFGWNPRQLLPCDACASGLDVSDSLCLHASKVANQISDSKDPSRIMCSPATSNRSHDTVDAENPHKVNSMDEDQAFHSFSNNSPGLPMLPPTPPRKTSSPTESNDTTSTLPLPQGFQLCSECRHVVYCSMKCKRDARDSYHANICANNEFLENYTHYSTILDFWQDTPRPPAQHLLSLLFLRLLSSIRAGIKNPLELGWMRCLHGDLDASRELSSDWDGQNVSTLDLQYDDDSTIPFRILYPEYDLLRDLEEEEAHDEAIHANWSHWSYNTNVVQPISYLMMLGGPELALNTARFDGWMLETLRTKIATGMRITRYPRFEKAFDNIGSLVAQACVGQDPVKNPYASPTTASPGTPTSITTAELDDGTDQNVTWMASLHPLMSLVRAAEPHETPNVKLFERASSMFCNMYSPLHALTQHQKRQRDTEKQDLDVMDIDVDVDVDTMPSICPGQPLLRTKEVAPTIGEGDMRVEDFRAAWGDGGDGTVFGDGSSGPKDKDDRNEAKAEDMEKKWGECKHHGSGSTSARDDLEEGVVEERAKYGAMLIHKEEGESGVQADFDEPEQKTDEQSDGENEKTTASSGWVTWFQQLKRASSG